MSRSGKLFQESICVFCGNTATTNDHIPPDGIFPDPKPNDLITVPACVTCNKSSQLDDEYFKWFISMASAQNPKAAALNKAWIDKKKDRPALLHQIWKGAKPKIDIYSPGGIFIGTRPGFEYDEPRIQKIIDKIIRGLYWRENHAVLGADYRVGKYNILSPDIPENMRNQIASLPLKSAGGDVFSYRVLQVGEYPGISRWWLMFYNQTLIFTFTDSVSNSRFEQ